MYEAVLEEKSTQSIMRHNGVIIVMADPVSTFEKPFVPTQLLIYLWPRIKDTLPNELYNFTWNNSKNYLLDI